MPKTEEQKRGGREGGKKGEGEGERDLTEIIILSDEDREK